MELLNELFKPFKNVEKDSRMKPLHSSRRITPTIFLKLLHQPHCSANCSAAGWWFNKPNAGFYKRRIVQYTQQLQEIFS